jgi:acetyl-CoA decarbonylase/synthase complex subunit delta
MQVDIPKDAWPGAVNTVTLGATAEDGGTRTRTVTIGGQRTLPFLHFEESPPHRPVLALEITAARPADWSSVLLDAWGDVVDDPGTWAAACEAFGADLIVLGLGLQDSGGEDADAGYAVGATRRVLESTGLPLIVLGPGQAETDNEFLVAVADATKGERLALGLCEDGNYRTIVAAALANDHLVVGRTPMDVNLAKQLNILITDMGLPLDRIVMDPTTGALGYGIEYGYSVMERLRIAALQGDSMTQLPLLVGPGAEAWKTKEAKVGDGVPEAWGNWAERAAHWETVTAIALVEAGADVVVLRHPDSLKRVRGAIDQLMAVG